MAARSARRACRTARTPATIASDEQHSSAGQQGAQPSVLAGLVANSVLRRLAFGVCERLPGVEEGLFGRDELRFGRLSPVERPSQSCAAVELGFVAAAELPVVGGGGDVAVDSQVVSCVVDPGSKARPFAQQRLVGGFGGVTLERDQAGRGEAFEYGVDFAGRP